MSDTQPWRLPVPPKPTSAAVRASSIAARNASPALTCNDARANSTSRAAIAAAVAGHTRVQAEQHANRRQTSASPTRGRSKLSQALDSATKRLEQSPQKDLPALTQHQQTTSQLAARLASASSSPTGRPADGSQLRAPSSRKADLMSRESSTSNRERSGSDVGATQQRSTRSKSPDKIDFSKLPPLASSAPSPHTIAPPSNFKASAAQPSSSSTRPHPHESSLTTSPPKLTVPDLSQKAATLLHLHHHNHYQHLHQPALRPASPANADRRKHSSSVGEAQNGRPHTPSISSGPPVEHHTRSSTSRLAGHNNSIHSSGTSKDASRIKHVSNLADAMVGASLASARVLPRTPSTHKKRPSLDSPQRRSHSLHVVESRHRPEPPPPLKPMTLRPMRLTLRKQHSHEDDDEEDKRGRKLRLRKHPNVHHEGDRKRWRDKLTVKQRKRYEGLWAANRGRLLHEFETFDHHRKGTSADDLVLNVVVRDIWERSRLPRDVLEEVWDLVAEEDDRALSREQFIAGLWLIDQKLKGRKLPVKVSPSVWASIRHPQGVKISSKRL